MEIRLAAESDAAEMIRLLRERYGENYGDFAMYDKKYVEEKLRRRDFQVAVAEENGELIAMGCAKADDAFEGTAVLCTFTTSNKAQNKGVFSKLVNKLCAIDYVGQNYTSLWTHDVTNHMFSQTAPNQCGLIPTGLVLESFLIDGKRVTMLSQSRKEAKTETGKLFVPDEVKNYVLGVYRELGCTITDAPTPAKAETRIVDYPAHCYAEYIGLLPRELPDRDSVNIFLNMNESDCLRDYDRAKKRGFFFTGVMPLVKNAEYMILHHSKNRAEAIAAIKTSQTFDGFSERKKFIREMGENG